MSAWRDDPDGADRLFDPDGQRKYLSAGERRRFIATARKQDPQTAALCLVLVYTGCRISEALALTPRLLDRETGRVIFRSLKRRRRTFRAVPIPPSLVASLCQLSRLEEDGDTRFWPWCRQTGWRRVKAVMDDASVIGPQAVPKGLRHGFGIANAEANVPPALTQRWLGHARLETTAIYAHATGAEERSFARRLWADS